MNRYSYCLNNPLIYTDPDGHVFVPTETASSVGDAYHSGKDHQQIVDRVIEINRELDTANTERTIELLDELHDLQNAGLKTTTGMGADVLNTPNALVQDITKAKTVKKLPTIVRTVLGAIKNALQDKKEEDKEEEDGKKKDPSLNTVTSEEDEDETEPGGGNSGEDETQNNDEDNNDF